MEPMLERLTKHEYGVLMENSKQINVKKGEFIFEEGSPANHLYFIQQGEIRIFKNLGSNKDITIFTRSKNDGFGEIGIFSGDNYSNSAQAVQDSKLYSITRHEIEEILAQNGRIGLHFTRWVAENLEASKAKMRDYIAFGSEGAVASVFVRYSNICGVDTPEGIQLTNPIMIQDISKHIAVSRETVSRIVNKWKEQGIIDNQNKHFILKDMSYFRRLLVCDQCGVQNCAI
ncbi:CRP/FNR family transcriptional regulator, anaerobic regulatory protein [Virgibacillus subterraneus]|uniref:CRP/FNR family transcriptional regulator, anaerobic regulatory protein n=2 Tax=Virgibacillus subterraneus TaxID=621109 RepID=A0A1H9FMQ6_9BACI|nr:CRP/FNR family transcriptional regulator, anaerobic regulatory protein [Virgibacillus subterraneus]